MDKIIQLQNDFLLDGKRPGIKHNALISDYANGGLKKVDIELKSQALKLSWIKRLYTGTDHPWKNIPNFLLEKNTPLAPFSQI